MFVPFPATSPTITSGPVLAPEPPLPAPAYTSRCPAPEGWDHSHPLHVLRASKKPVPCRRMPVPLYGHSQSPSKTHLRSPLPSASVLEMSSSSCPRVGQGSRTAAPSLKKELRVPFSSLPPSSLPICVPTALYTESRPGSSPPPPPPASGLRTEMVLATHQALF